MAEIESEKFTQLFETKFALFDQTLTPKELIRVILIFKRLLITKFPITDQKNDKST